MTTGIFRDEALTQRFIADGFVIVPLLDQAEVAQLLQDLESLRPQQIEPLHRPQLENDTDYRRRTDEAIRAVFDSKIEAVFNEFRTVLATTVVKAPNEGRSDLPMHVDTSFVDESRFVSAIVWCPLIDVTRSNGCLRVVPGSEHHFFPVRVFSTKEGVINHPFNNVMPIVVKYYTKEIEIPAGHAVVYNARLIHGSGPNMSNKPRVAVVCVVAPKLAPIHVSVPISDSEAEIVEIDKPSFFWTYQCNEPPVGVRRVGKTVYKLQQLTESELRNSPHLRARRSSWFDWRRYIPYG